MYLLSCSCRLGTMIPEHCHGLVASDYPINKYYEFFISLNLIHKKDLQNLLFKHTT